MYVHPQVPLYMDRWPKLACIAHGAAAADAQQVCPGADTSACCCIPLMLQAYWRNVKARPWFMLLPPVLIFCVLCALGVMGVALGADKFEAESRSRAESAALDWVRGRSCWLLYPAASLSARGAQQ